MQDGRVSERLRCETGGLWPPLGAPGRGAGWPRSRTASRPPRTACGQRVGRDPRVRVEGVVSGITEFGCEGSLDVAGKKAEVRGAPRCEAHVLTATSAWERVVRRSSYESV